MFSKNISEKKRGILILTPFFSPNIGGVETHLDDLAAGLVKRGFRVYVQTYSPITTPGVPWKPREKRKESIFIRRYRWFGKNLFHRLEKYPWLDFFYLTPYLFFRSAIWLSANRQKIGVIHAQGLNAALAGSVFKKIFRKKLVVSLHAVYEIDPTSPTAKKIAGILNQADAVLAPSRASLRELDSFGVETDKLGLYKHWIDLEKFTPGNKTELRHKIGLENKFTVLFVGRLIEKKGVKILAETAKSLPETNFVFIGTGPLENFLKDQAKKNSNIKCLGGIESGKVADYYAGADVVCIPSDYAEGFGRVAMEAVACGVPVVCSNRGGLREALDMSVSLSVAPTPENLAGAIRKLRDDKKLYQKLQSNCRAYAEENFSEKNISLITRHY